MVAGSFTFESVSPFSPSKIWKSSILDAHVLMPKLAPEAIVSVKIIEGNGGVGTVKEFIFTDVVTEYKFLKDRIDVLDEENHIFKYSVIEGGLLGSRMKSYSFELVIEATSNGGSLTKLKVEYDTIDDTLLTVEEIDLITSDIIANAKALDDYLAANPNLYN